MRMSPACSQLPSSSAPSPTSGILAGFAAGGGGDTATGAAVLPLYVLPPVLVKSGQSDPAARCLVQQRQTIRAPAILHTGTSRTLQCRLCDYEHARPLTRCQPCLEQEGRGPPGGGGLRAGSPRRTRRPLLAEGVLCCRCVPNMCVQVRI